tara:strand:+ start:1281 stop:2042 length:762 start_codon:yes stop_codon:yes gene_type:complete
VEDADEVQSLVSSFTTVTDKPRTYGSSSHLIQKFWKTISLPIGFANLNVETERDSYFGKQYLGLLSFQQNWLAAFFEATDTAPDSEVIFFRGYEPQAAIQCPAEPDLLLEVYGNFEAALFAVGFNYMIDTCKRWMIITEPEEFTILSAEVSLMDRFMADNGGEHLLQFMFAHHLNWSRILLPEEGLKARYEPLSWSNPFSHEADASKLDRHALEDFQIINDIMLLEKFKVDPEPVLEFHREIREQSSDNGYSY